MRISFLLTGLGLSGGARVVFEYANRLIERGHEVTVICPILPLLLQNSHGLRGLRQDAGSLKNAGKRPTVDWFDLKARIVRVPSLRPQHIRLVERLIPDADVVIATAKETALPVSRLSPSKGEKFYFIQQYEIWDLWDDEACWQAAEKIAGSKDRLSLAMYEVVPADGRLQKFKELVDSTYRLPLRKITISTWLQTLLESKFSQPVDKMIINGVNFETFCQTGVRSGDRVRVLMPYRPYPNKGGDDGLQALAAARKDFPDTEFHLYGDRRGKSLPEWVHFHENVTDEELRALYNMADIFLSPSWTEGCQLPPMEAMACGCAVVSTSVGGIPDYSINGETVLASPPREPGLLAANLLRLVGNAEERARIARNGHAHIQQFTWDRAVAEFEAALQAGVKKGL